MKKVAIILLNYKSQNETAECLGSLENIQTKDIEIETIIVDNSPNDSGNTIKESIKKATKLRVDLIENPHNTGFTGGNNLGIVSALARGFDFFLILNNDTLLERNFLMHLVKAADSDKKIGMTVPKIYFAKGHEFHKDRYTKRDLGNVIWYAGGILDWKNCIGLHRGVDEIDTGQYNKIENTDYATGACMLLKRELVESIGMFDEKYFLYYEDSDLSLRAKKKGWDIIYVPESIVWHKNAASTGGSGSGLQDYYITRNRLLFASRYAPLRTKVALLKESLMLLKHGRKYQKKGVQDFFQKKFGKAKFEIE